MNSITVPHVVGTAVSTAILFCGVAVYDNLPSVSGSILNDYANSGSVDYGLSLDRYQLLSKENIQKNNIEVIHGFASNLLENIEDIPAEFNEAVDRNFWDLV